MTDDWRTDLADSVARGLTADGLEAVTSALGSAAEALRVHPDAPVDPLRPDRPLLGVLGCEAGYLGVLLTEAGRISVHAAGTRSGLLDQVRETADPYVVEARDHDGSGTSAERREALRREGFAAPGWFSGSGFTEGELLDACAAVVAAVAGQARRDGGGESSTSSR